VEPKVVRTPIFTQEPPHEAWSPLAAEARGRSPSAVFLDPNRAGGLRAGAHLPAFPARSTCDAIPRPGHAAPARLLECRRRHGVRARWSADTQALDSTRPSASPWPNSQVVRVLTGVTASASGSSIYDPAISVSGHRPGQGPLRSHGQCGRTTSPGKTPRGDLRSSRSFAGPDRRFADHRYNMGLNVAR